jgi:hypothetical protein
MIDRLIVGVVLSIVGWNGLHPAEPVPMTPAQLQVKAKDESISKICNKKKKSEKVKRLCKKWGKSSA